MEGLFLLDVSVISILFSPTVKPLPRKKDLKIIVKFDKIANLVIKANNVIRIKNRKETDERLYTIGSGESVLFFGKTQDLLYKLRTCHLNLTIYMKGYLLGSTAVPWKENFISIVEAYQISEEESFVPAIIKDHYDFYLNNGFMGTIKVFIRLYCLSNRIERDIRRIKSDRPDEEKNFQYLFGGEEGKTIFIAQKCGYDIFSENIAVTPLYRPEGDVEHEEKAWQSLYESESVDNTSVGQNIFFPEHQNEVKVSTYGLEFTKKHHDLHHLEQEVEPCTRTTESLEKVLCNNPDCPAIKKLQVYGVGSLATTKGIGCLSGHVDVPLKYGISQTYGVFKSYGPYGILTKISSQELKYLNEEGRGLYGGSPLELKGGNEILSKPLRLKGGAPISDTISKVAEPIAACKVLMQQMDDVVNAFREALSPCGEAACPYNPAAMKESCKKTCRPSSNNNIAACGSPSCPYTKLREENQLDYDALMELQLMDSEMVKTCGSPQCPFPLSPPLEPIHWDCIDPLPKGPCKNPNCPYKSRAAPTPREGPCGSNKCPYAAPRPCGNPICPFRKRKPCPYGDDSSSSCSDPSCVLNKQRKPVNCSNPLCPNASNLRKSNTRANSQCIGQPSGECFVQTCSNPECQFKNQNSANCPDELITAGIPSKCCNKSSSNRPTKNASGCSNCPNRQDNCASNCAPSNQNIGKQSDIKSQPNLVNYNECGSINDAFQDDEDNKSFVCNDPCCPYTLPICCVCGKTFIPCPPPCPPPPSCSPCKGAEGVCDDLCSPCPPQPCSPPPPCPPGYPVCPECMGYKPKSSNIDQCNLNSCAAMGGSVACEECKKSAGDSISANDKGRKKSKEESSKFGQGDESNRSAKNKSSKEVSKKKKKINLDAIRSKVKNLKKKLRAPKDRYPGVKIGHQFCCGPGFRVPRRQGWLWNTYVPCLGLKPRRGWRPGAITATVANRIMAHKRAIQRRIPSQKSSRKRRKQDDSASDVTVAPRPTLEIHRKEGAYWITMNPIKEPNTIDEQDPYMDCMPMEFRITKNKEKVMIKGADDDDYRTCYCGDDEEEKHSSDSDLDIEFSPPGLLRHRALKRRNKPKTEADTQYDPADFATLKATKKGGKKGKGDKGKGKKGKKGKKK